MGGQSDGRDGISEIMPPLGKCSIFKLTRGIAGSLKGTWSPQSPFARFLSTQKCSKWQTLFQFMMQNNFQQSRSSFCDGDESSNKGSMEKHSTLIEKGPISHNHSLNLS